MIALVCMLMAAGAAMAQKTFTIGPKVGLDYTHWWAENINVESALSYQAGVFMEYRMNNKFAIAFGQCALGLMQFKADGLFPLSRKIRLDGHGL